MQVGAIRLATTLALAVVLLAVAAQPLSAASQAAIGIAGVAAMIGIRLLRLQGYWRHLFYVIAGILIVRYVYWRTTSTIPSSAELENFIPGVILYGAEMFCVMVLFINLFVIAGPVTRRKAPLLSPEDAPTVDVFIPTYNEPKDILIATLASAKAMIYPADKLTVYLLDDGGTDQKVNDPDPDVSEKAAERRRDLQDLCAELGAVYLTRPFNEQAKAGNLTHALGHSKGELIAVFDADHAPARNFLQLTVGHFSTDDRLFLVQTPHQFLNPDPIERNLGTFKRMPSENEMFYGMIQKGLDKWNAAFFCGSAALLRRTALEEAGGFSGASITEDCETALELHSRGWHSLYVDTPLVAGLQPETFAAFIGQRSRWCRGMLQILILKNPLFHAGLTMAQRICYLSSSMFWLFPLPRTIFLLAPLMYLFFDLQIYNSTLEEFCAYTISYLAASLIMQNYNYGQFRWPWVSELYEYVQTIYLLPAIVSVIRNPRRPVFNVTAKGVTTEEDSLSELAWPYFAVVGVLLLALAIGVMRFNAETEARGMLVIVSIWNLLNLVIAAVALGVVCERRERRRAQRLPIEWRGSLVSGTTTVPVIIREASMGGLKLLPAASQTALPLRKACELTIETRGGRPPAIFHGIVVNAQGDSTQRIYGWSFTELNTEGTRLIAELMYGDLGLLSRIRLGRQRVRSLLVGTAEVFAWSITYLTRGLYFAVFRRPATGPGPGGA